MPGKVRVKRHIRRLFFEPKHKKIADIISIKSVEEAKKSIKKILELAKKNIRKYTPKQWRGFLILAGVRAKLLAKKKDISPEKRKEKLKIAKLYLDWGLPQLNKILARYY